jgi:hypothetical protein
MRRTTSIPAVLVLGLGLALAGCGDDETGPAHDHTPASAALFAGTQDVTSDLRVRAGQVLRVQVRFFDDEGNEITGIEDDHQTRLVFTPADLVTTADVAGRNFQKDLTAGAASGTGSYTIGYGHDEDADELTFGPHPVTVTTTGGGGEPVPLVGTLEAAE